MLQFFVPPVTFVPDIWWYGDEIYMSLTSRIFTPPCFGTHQYLKLIWSQETARLFVTCDGLSWKEERK